MFVVNFAIEKFRTEFSLGEHYADKSELCYDLSVLKESEMPEELQSRISLPNEADKFICLVCLTAFNSKNGIDKHWMVTHVTKKKKLT